VRRVLLGRAIHRRALFTNDVLSCRCLVPRYKPSTTLGGRRSFAYLLRGGLRTRGFFTGRVQLHSQGKWCRRYRLSRVLFSWPPLASIAAPERFHVCFTNVGGIVLAAVSLAQAHILFCQKIATFTTRKPHFRSISSRLVKNTTIELFLCAADESQPSKKPPIATIYAQGGWAQPHGSHLSALFVFIIIKSTLAC
jgi:hypothetical protein